MSRFWVDSGEGNGNSIGMEVFGAGVGDTYGFEAGEAGHPDEKLEPIDDREVLEWVVAGNVSSLVLKQPESAADAA